MSSPTSRAACWVLSVLCVTVAVGAAAAPPASAQVPAPTLTVTPSTGLVTGQTVQLAGSGLLPGTAYIVTCPPGVVDGYQCDFGGVSLPPSTTVAADGTFATPFTVSRFITGSAGLIDCALVACTIGIGDINQQRTATAVVDFVDGPPPPVDLEVSAVDDRGYVVVDGSGFRPNHYVSLAQCAPGVTTLEGCETAGSVRVTTDAAGSFSRQLEVRRDVAEVVAGAPALRDCLNDACTIIADHPSQPVVGQAPLDLTGFPDQAVTFQVVPATGLADRQLVQVSGSGFRPNGVAFLRQCGPGAHLLDGCASAPVTRVFHDATGSFAATFEVRRDVVLDPGDLGSVRDCALEACSLLIEGATPLVDELNTRRRVLVPLDLVDTPRPPVAPSLAAAAVGPGGDQFQVTGSGFPLGGEYVISPCTSVPEDCRLEGSAPAVPDSTGSFTATITAPRLAGGVDCLRATCSAVARPRAVPGGPVLAQTPLVFPVPQLTIAISDVGTLEAGTNEAVVQAEISCDLPTPVSVSGSISQPGIEGVSQFADQPCTPAEPLLAFVTTPDLTIQDEGFSLGPATVTVNAVPYASVGPEAPTVATATTDLVDEDAVAAIVQALLQDPANTEMRAAVLRAIRARAAQDPIFRQELYLAIYGS